MSDAMASQARVLRGARLLLAANGVLWIVLGAMWLERSFWGPAAAPYQALLMTALMLGNATILISLSFQLGATKVRLLRVALVWVGVNLLLSFTDEVGPADLVVGALNAVTCLLLLMLLRARGRPSP